MDFQTLCSRIHLQKEVQEEAARYCETADFARMRLLATGILPG